MIEFVESIVTQYLSVVLFAVFVPKSVPKVVAVHTYQVRSKIDHFAQVEEFPGVLLNWNEFTN